MGEMKSSFDPFLIWLVFLLTGASPRLWSKTVRQQHVASLLYSSAEVLHSMGSGGSCLRRLDLEDLEEHGSWFINKKLKALWPR